MRRIPRTIAAAIAVGHADLHCGTNAVAPYDLAARARRVAGVIVAGVIDIGTREGAAIGFRAGDYFVPVAIGRAHYIFDGVVPRVREVPQPIDDLPLFREVGQLRNI